MTAIALKQIVTEALAEVGVDVASMRLPTGKPRETTWLGIEPGFGVRHYATGRNIYIVQTRMAGRLRTVTIGPASVITRHQATVVARRVLAYARVGLDPVTERKRIRSAPRFDDFLEEYWQRWSGRWKASTLVANEKYRRLYLDDAFPDIFIDALNEADVTRWFADLNNRMGPGGANRVVAILSSLLNKAESWGYRLENTNPCRAVRPNRKRKCERFLSRAELERLGEALARVRSSEDKVRPIAATAIALLLLTGCRAGEITSLQWQDLRGNRLKLRDSKTGPRTVWLGDEARALIDDLPRLKNIPWLFWSPRVRKPLRWLDYYWHEIRSEAGLRGVRLHDLRHTFASHAAMNKETLPMIGRLLGHSNQQSTARYAHLGDEHVLDAAEQIGAAIERMLG
ncbi:site-specific integrase [Novosphingobium sp. G106]|uniref:tyrosine-type recombinase/integrase n=1 Tax=Novosphingobium sp. G106 TaxID=2849500 RepID=UPI001C2CECE6|nr:site-specific integrase [Novosphingobium sp. G106]MBV1692340.1 site-specific integrase [Novosphingobium sp. G106]